MTGKAHVKARLNGDGQDDHPLSQQVGYGQSVDVRGKPTQKRPGNPRQADHRFVDRDISSAFIRMYKGVKHEIETESPGIDAETGRSTGKRR